MSEAVLLVSHGTVDDLDDLGAFVKNVRHGHAPPPELVSELRRHYEAIGGKSPLNAINAQIARALEHRLRVRVEWANRLWKPYVRDVLAALARDGITRVALVPLAQHSAHVYADDARRAAHGTGIEVAASSCWGQNAKLCAAFAWRIGETLAPVQGREGVTLVMTAHSLPRSVIDAGDPYEREVRASAEAIMVMVRAKSGRDVHVTVAFQSQTPNGPGMGPPIQWLGPDLRAALDGAKKRGDRHAVFAPDVLAEVAQPLLGHG
jgi:ferrochelatase